MHLKNQKINLDSLTTQETKETTVSTNSDFQKDALLAKIKSDTKKRPLEKTKKSNLSEVAKKTIFHTDQQSLTAEDNLVLPPPELPKSIILSRSESRSIDDSNNPTITFENPPGEFALFHELGTHAIPHITTSFEDDSEFETKNKPNDYSFFSQNANCKNRNKLNQNILSNEKNHSQSEDPPKDNHWPEDFNL